VSLTSRIKTCLDTLGYIYLFSFSRQQAGQTVQTEYNVSDSTSRSTIHVVQVHSTSSCQLPTSSYLRVASSNIYIYKLHNYTTIATRNMAKVQFYEYAVCMHMHIYIYIYIQTIQRPYVDVYTRIYVYTHTQIIEIRTCTYYESTHTTYMNSYIYSFII